MLLPPSSPPEKAPKKSSKNSQQPPERVTTSIAELVRQQAANHAIASLHPMTFQLQYKLLESSTLHTDTEKQRRQIAFWNHQRTIGSGELYALHVDLEFH
jgi:hypothetical protein